MDSYTHNMKMKIRERKNKNSTAQPNRVYCLINGNELNSTHTQTISFIASLSGLRYGCMACIG